MIYIYIVLITIILCLYVYINRSGNFINLIHANLGPVHKRLIILISFNSVFRKFQQVRADVRGN